MGKRIGTKAMVDGNSRRRFEYLLREHQRIVFKVAGVYARDTHDRDDLAQEIAMQLWRSYRSFDAARAKFSTWMYRVALNVAISHARTASRSAAVWVAPLDDLQEDSVAANDPAHDESLQRAQRVAALHAFIGGLDALNRALVLLYLEDRSYADIAEVLGISETNVATKINRMKQTMRAQLANPDNDGAEHGTR